MKNNLFCTKLSANLKKKKYPQSQGLFANGQCISQHSGQFITISSLVPAKLFTWCKWQNCCWVIVGVLFVLVLLFVFSVVFLTYLFGLKVVFCERVVRYFYKPLNHSSATVVFPCSLVHVHAVALHLLFALKVPVRNSSEWPLSNKLQVVHVNGWCLCPAGYPFVNK